jgi:Class III cytochrome C family
MLRSDNTCWAGSGLSGAVIVFVCLFAGLSLISVVCAADPAPPQKYNPADEFHSGNINCGLCHFCEKPTQAEPCLYKCPRYRQVPDTDLKTPIDNGPDEVILSALEHFYNPTVFNHKLHAEMAEMAKGCRECHHYSPEGEYPACSSCHKPGIHADNLEQVGLKGAYHRQCIGCHREWSRETDCEICHSSKSSTVKSGIDKTHKSHFPLVEAPDTQTYQTGFRGNSTVVFNHQSHAEEYGLRCQICHHGNGCLPCHVQLAGGKKMEAKPMTKGCLDCHGDMDCYDCHSVSPGSTPFNHDKTGFPLKAYHEKNQCRECHDREIRHHGFPAECATCHKETWKPGTFNHQVTGVKLDEIHAEVDCSECHSENKYTAPPQCKNCHGTDVSYPDVVPGELIK